MSEAQLSIQKQSLWFELYGDSARPHCLHTTMTYNEHGCAYHEPRVHHATVDCSLRIQIMMEERRKENYMRIKESRRVHNDIVIS